MSIAASISISQVKIIASLKESIYFPECLNIRCALMYRILD